MTDSRTVARAAIRRLVIEGLERPVTAGRQRIMLAVLTLAVSKGGSALSMRAIAKEVNMQAASLYSHFPGGKDQILEATLRWTYLDFLEATLKPVGEQAETLTAEEELRGVVAGQVAWEIDSAFGTLFEIVVATDLAEKFLSDDAHATIALYRGSYVDYIETIARELRDEPNARARAWAVIIFLNDTVTFSHYVSVTTTRDEIVEEAYRCCRAIIEGPPSMATAPNQQVMVADGTTRSSGSHDTSH